MPIEWAVVFLGTIIACVYFSYNAGRKQGISDATLLTLATLEIEGLIHFDNRGNIQSGNGKKFIGDLINERDGK